MCVPVCRTIQQHIGDFALGCVRAYKPRARECAAPAALPLPPSLQLCSAGRPRFPPAGSPEVARSEKKKSTVKTPEQAVERFEASAQAVMAVLKHPFECSHLSFCCLELFLHGIVLGSKRINLKLQTHTRTHTHRHTHTHTHTHTDAHAHTRTHTHTQMHAHAQMHAHRCTRT